MLHFALGDGAEEHDGISHPHGGNQNINRPFQLGVFLALGVAQGQGNHRQHNHQLPAPKGERGQPVAAKQPCIASALHHIIRCGNQATAAKGKNHGIGVQRTDAPEVKPRRNVRQIQRGPAQFCGGIHAHKHPNDAPNHRHNGKLAHHFIVIGLRFHNNSIR